MASAPCRGGCLCKHHRWCWLLAIALCSVELIAEDAKGEALPLVMLVDVYDTTFLVGSKLRCSPACAREFPEECTKDLHNDDVTRFGLGQRAEFGIVRDAGCPFPHLTGVGAPHAGANHIAAIIHTDFSLGAVFDANGVRTLDASDVAVPGEALNYTGTLRAAWIVEPRQMFPPAYEEAVRRRGDFDVIFTHVRELTARYPDKFRFCPFGTTYLRQWEHAMYPKDKLLSVIASRQGSLVLPLVKHLRTCSVTCLPTHVCRSLPLARAPMPRAAACPATECGTKRFDNSVTALRGCLPRGILIHR